MRQRVDGRHAEGANQREERVGVVAVARNVGAERNVVPCRGAEHQQHNGDEVREQRLREILEELEDRHCGEKDVRSHRVRGEHVEVRCGAEVDVAVARKVRR